MTPPLPPRDDGALRHQLDQLRVLYALTETLMASTDLPQMYEAAMDGFHGALGVERVSILISEDDGVPRFKAWRGLSERYRQAVDGHSFWAPDDPNPAPVVIADAGTDPALEAFRAVVQAEGIASLVAVPLVVKGRTIGKCMLYFDRPRVLAADELRLAHTVADHVAFAVERKRAEDALAASSSLLRSIIDGTPDIVLVEGPHRPLPARQSRRHRVRRPALRPAGRARLRGLDPGNARAVPEFDRLVMDERRTIRHDLVAPDEQGALHAFHAPAARSSVRAGRRVGGVRHPARCHRAGSRAAAGARERRALPLAAAERLGHHLGARRRRHDQVTRAPPSTVCSAGPTPRSWVATPSSWCIPTIATW
ncbi:MAG: GAF domain-containing protein [Vicinamibacterales bacterium]